MKPLAKRTSLGVVTLGPQSIEEAHGLRGIAKPVMLTGREATPAAVEDFAPSTAGKEVISIPAKAAGQAYDGDCLRLSVRLAAGHPSDCREALCRPAVTPAHTPPGSEFGVARSCDYRTWPNLQFNYRNLLKNCTDRQDNPDLDRPI